MTLSSRKLCGPGIKVGTFRSRHNPYSARVGLELPSTYLNYLLVAIHVLGPCGCFESHSSDSRLFIHQFEDCFPLPKDVQIHSRCFNRSLFHQLRIPFRIQSFSCHSTISPTCGRQTGQRLIPQSQNQENPTAGTSHPMCRRKLLPHAPSFQENPLYGTWCP